MNQTDTVELAIQAGIRFRRNVFYSEYCDGVDVRDLVVFAKLVAAKEREACANICEYYEDYAEGNDNYHATTIRARGQE